MTRPRLPRTVWVLGLASLLNDTASEMIMPLLPVFLTIALYNGAYSLATLEEARTGTARALAALAIGAAGSSGSGADISSSCPPARRPR